jgi:membrane-bound ClpP family serine protease
MLIGGLILLLLGWFLGISILLWIGVIVLVIGAVLLIAGQTGHPVGGRSNYW